MLPALSLIFLAACAGEPTGPSIAPAARPIATDIPANTAKASYWFDMPATTGATSQDFDKLCNACQDTARDFLFSIDRTDYREGLITTRPMISKQFFEFWRRDTATVDDCMQSSLQTIRRTIRFEIVHEADGSYSAHPKVVVERQSYYQRRITSVAEYRYVFTPTGPESTFQTDQGKTLPIQYWYAIGRDQPLERELASAIQQKLHHR